MLNIKLEWGFNVTLVFWLDLSRQNLQCYPGKFPNSNLTNSTIKVWVTPSGRLKTGEKKKKSNLSKHKIHLYCLAGLCESVASSSLLNVYAAYVLVHPQTNSASSEVSGLGRTQRSPRDVCQCPTPTLQEGAAWIWLMSDLASPRLTGLSAGPSMASCPKPPLVLHNKKTYLAGCKAASQQQPRATSQKDHAQINGSIVRKIS